MGVLGGLFLLGMLTRRATGWGALLGAIAGTGVTAWLKLHSPISGYLYAAIGIPPAWSLVISPVSFCQAKSSRSTA